MNGKCLQKVGYTVRNKRKKKRHFLHHHHQHHKHPVAKSYIMS